MMDAYNSPTSLQAVDAEKRLVKLIEKKSTNVKKMNSLRHGGGEEKRVGKNGAAHSHRAKHPLRRWQMQNLCTCPDIGKVCWTW